MGFNGPELAIQLICWSKPTNKKKGVIFISLKQMLAKKLNWLLEKMTYINIGWQKKKTGLYLLNQVLILHSFEVDDFYKLMLIRAAEINKVVLSDLGQKGENWKYLQEF